MEALYVKERLAQKIADARAEIESNSKRSDPNQFTGMYYLGRESAFTYALELFKTFIGEI